MVTCYLRYVRMEFVSKHFSCFGSSIRTITGQKFEADQADVLLIDRWAVTQGSRQSLYCHLLSDVDFMCDLSQDTVQSIIPPNRRFASCHRGAICAVLPANH